MPPCIPTSRSNQEIISIIGAENLKHLQQRLVTNPRSKSNQIYAHGN